MKRILILIVSLFLINTGICCTTAVISGKYTKDGRPMIWKLRDTDFLKNKMMYFSDGKFNYIGLVNSKDLKGEQIWAGANSVGFSIMNSASFNVNLNDTSSLEDLEGYFMKEALQTCATLEDFEQLIKNRVRPMGIAAHFGVIDANGGAAFYEVNNYTFTKFDANDVKVAPNGYIIRTNFSFTGKKDIGYGFIRYKTAEDIFGKADSKNKLNYKSIIQDFTRCFNHPVLNKNFREEYENIPEGEHFINSGDLITRHGSSSSILVKGVKPNDPSDLATIWTTIGFPNTCITVPVWVRGGSNLPKVLVADTSNNSPLNNMALELKKQCYPIDRSSGYKYLQISKLFNSDKTGIIPKIESVEKDIFKETEEKLLNWRIKKPKPEAINNYYNWLDNVVIKTYSKEFGIKLN